MGIGRTSKKQLAFFKTNWQHQFQHGGILRNKRQGRGFRLLACREPLHVVFKINKSKLKHRSFRSQKGFAMVHRIIHRYAKMFFIKVEQLSVQNDHLHLLIRTSRRSLFHYFFRVVAGQIAQQFEKEGLCVTDTPETSQLAVNFWKHRPFSRVVRGYKAYRIVRDYIELNEKEILKEMKYKPGRLKDLSREDWQQLWN